MLCSIAEDRPTGRRGENRRRQPAEMSRFVDTTCPKINRRFLLRYGRPIISAIKLASFNFKLCWSVFKTRDAFFFQNKRSSFPNNLSQPINLNWPIHHQSEPTSDESNHTCPVGNRGRRQWRPRRWKISPQPSTCWIVFKSLTKVFFLKVQSTLD